eukprot:4235808-Alexandrium_andersonii.AAC.1
MYPPRNYIYSGAAKRRAAWPRPRRAARPRLLLLAKPISQWPPRVPTARSVHRRHGGARARDRATARPAWCQGLRASPPRWGRPGRRGPAHEAWAMHPRTPWPWPLQLPKRRLAVGRHGRR